MPRLFHDLSTVYQRDIVAAGKEAQLAILLAFLLTFLIVRLVTHAIRSRRLSFLHDISSGGTHIHHLVWGILLLLATGYTMIAFDVDSHRVLLGILFGVGAALTIDEFALWLHLEDVYWTEQGRRSIDAVIMTSTLFAVVVLGKLFLVDAGRVVGRSIGII